MRVFFDTSAYVKRFVEEVGSDKADEITQKATEIGLSILCFPEMMSALNRKQRTGFLNENDYLTLKTDIVEDIEDAELINLSPGVLAKATGLLEKHVLRSLDALHIACAFEWQADLFVSSDERQLEAALDSGLMIEFIEGYKK